jgi:threonine dehydrogenase-like Zn-dependent dehydrogenase
VHRWVPEILPLLLDGDPLGTDDFATHRLPLDAAPEAYATFQARKDGMVKTLLQPGLQDSALQDSARRSAPVSPA